MDLITLDFETYYNKEYSLKKLTTEEYVRDPRFEVLGVAIKVNNRMTEWASGTQEQLKTFLQRHDWNNAMVLAHNTMFDGAILSWIFDIKPRAYTDTVCIARAVNGVEESASLKALSQKYGVGKKGDEIQNTLDKHRQDLTDEELGRLGDYAVNDVDLTYDLFTIMARGFPKKELKLIDLSLRMFVEPVLAAFWVDFWYSLEHRRLCLDCAGVYGLHIHRFPEKFTVRMLWGPLLKSFWHLK